MNETYRDASPEKRAEIDQKIARLDLLLWMRRRVKCQPVFLPIPVRQR